MPLLQQRPFPLDHSLHASLFEMPTHCLGGDGLVGDVHEGSGDLCSILCLLGGDEMKSMTNIGSCELARMTRRVLWKVGTVLGVNSGHSTNRNTSSSVCLGY